MWIKEHRLKEKQALVTVQRKIRVAFTFFLIQLGMRIIFRIRVEKFSMLLQSRLRNSYAIFVKVSDVESLHASQQRLPFFFLTIL